MPRLLLRLPPPQYKYLSMHLQQHTVQMCRCVKSWYISNGNPREQLDKAPAHQCSPEVLHTISQLLPSYSHLW